MGTKIIVGAEEDIRVAVRRFRREVYWDKRIPIHKRLIKKCVRKGEKRRQQRLSDKLHQWWFESRNNPSPQ